MLQNLSACQVHIGINTVLDFGSQLIESTLCLFCAAAFLNNPENLTLEVDSVGLDTEYFVRCPKNAVKEVELV